VVVEDDSRQAWLDRAACRDQDPERFFPDFGEQVKAAEAKAICASCQVRDHCLQLAVKSTGGLVDDHGIFGGTLPAERARPRRNTFPSPAPTGRTAGWPKPPTPWPARSGCGRPPASSASTAAP
jgi:WhiB family redox-sensing transcriptional regulator